MEIKILDLKAFNVAIFNAMAAASIDDDVVRTFGLKPDGDNSVADVEVLVTVNGVAVPFTEQFIEAVNSMVGDQVAEYNKQVKDAALKLVKGSKLAALLEVLCDAEWELEKVLDQVGIEVNAAG